VTTASALATIEPSALPGPGSLRVRREQALARFEEGPLPTDADEIWRYSRINELDPGRFAPARPAAPPSIPGPVRDVLDTIPERSATVLTVDGALALSETDGRGLRVHPASELGSLAGVAPWDAFVELNTAQAPTPLVIDVTGSVAVPIVVCHWTSGVGKVTFPRTLIRVAPGAAATVVEYHLSTDVLAWVDPVTEIEVADGGRLDHLVVQELGPAVWSTAYVVASIGVDARLRSFTVALGGDYARVRTESRVVGAGGEAQLLALYCGAGTQMHDFRTLQDHAGPKSTSDLVFKGAVTGEARSAYSGLIRVERGAAGTKAFQTNRNLVLSDTGLAIYSVPNLDIEENDVVCSHASATGPIDPEQRFYLESRGVPTEVAERLIVLGFFDDLLLRLPVAGLRPHLASVIGHKLGVSGGFGGGGG
jgi:Fe-S cluster assembly protein SufD